MSDDYEDLKVGNVLNKRVRHVAYGWFAMVVAALVVLTVVGAGLAFLGGWFGEAQRQVSPANVKAQFAFVYDDLNSLKASARQVCTAEQAVQLETDPQARIQRETQLLTIENNYNRIAGEYDAHLADTFRSKYIRPHDVPSSSPSIADMKLEVCP